MITKLPKEIEARLAGKRGEPQELTAMNAVASTFGMRGEEYVLELET